MEVINYETYQKPSDYHKFDEGETVLRILTKGAIGQTVGLRMGGKFTPLGWAEEEQAKNAIAKGAKVKKTYRWVAWNYKTSKVRLLDAGVMLGDGICELAKVNGDPTTYDIIVKAIGKGLQRKYSVQKATKNLVAPTREEKESEIRYLVEKYMTVKK